MTQEDKLVERITYLTKLALGEELEPYKGFNEAILQAAVKAAKVGYSFAVDEAAEWLEKNVADIWNSPCNPDKIVENFRKAMKGGED